MSAPTPTVEHLGWNIQHGIHLRAADRATAGHGSDKARWRILARDLPPGGPGPIDRTYAVTELVPALVGAEILTGPGSDEVSDHLPQSARWSLPGLWAVMDRSVRLIRH